MVFNYELDHALQWHCMNSRKHLLDGSPCICARSSERTTDQKMHFHTKMVVTAKSAGGYLCRDIKSFLELSDTQSLVEFL